MTTTSPSIVENVFNLVGKYVHEHDEFLADLGFVQGIDEIALMFTNEACLLEFISQAVQHDGCILFNKADDHVHTLPLKTHYDVEYYFLSLPMAYLEQPREVRLECMLLNGGVSPLHIAEAVDLPHHYCKPIHASFKVADEVDYAGAVHRLREGGWEAAQRCESTYGRFSYWTLLDEEVTQPNLYLKPRVNLRDGQQSLI